MHYFLENYTREPPITQEGGILLSATLRTSAVSYVSQREELQKLHSDDSRQHFDFCKALCIFRIVLDVREQSIVSGLLTSCSGRFKKNNQLSNEETRSHRGLPLFLVPLCGIIRSRGHTPSGASLSGKGETPSSLGPPGRGRTTKIV